MKSDKPEEFEQIGSVAARVLAGVNVQRRKASEQPQNGSEEFNNVIAFPCRSPCRGPEAVDSPPSSRLGAAQARRMERVKG